MMTKDEFNKFLKSIGGLVDRCTTRPESPHFLFGVECDDGWLQLIADLIRELVDIGWKREILQIKEKFGMLCFYAAELPENGEEIISRYEQRSFSICEICGTEQNVSTRDKHWLKTLCNDCVKAWREKYVN